MQQINANNFNKSLSFALNKDVCNNSFVINQERNMQDLTEKVRNKLKSGMKISVIQRETQISRHMINKILKGVEVPHYLITTLNDYFKKFGE
jgi:hypothetical protein